MKNKMKCIICWSLIPVIMISMLIYFESFSIPKTIFLRENQELKSNYIIKLDKNKPDLKNSKNKEEKINVSLLGVLPIKSVSVKCVSDIYVYPGGTPIGVKLTTKGVLVVALSDVETSKGKISSPSAQGGIQVGDIILKINDVEINGSEDLVKEVNLNKDESMNMTIERKNEILQKTITPKKDKINNIYKIGLWVRDSTSGVGTLTFYDNKTKKFGALGHPITDVDTGTILKVNNGEIINSSIMSIIKGEKGNPGELRGIFMDEDKKLGNVSKNTFCGIYGEGTEKLIFKKYNKPMKIALRQEIKEGPAKILTTIEGSEPKLYDIQIQKLLPQDNPGPKSMVIKVTDKELIGKTGGIVQGMSGSPIIQDNKLVGAITHVLINRPDVGYGIYIEWMLKDAGILTIN